MIIFFMFFVYRARLGFSVSLRSSIESWKKFRFERCTKRLRQLEFNRRNSSVCWGHVLSDDCRKMSGEVIVRPSSPMLWLRGGEVTGWRPRPGSNRSRESVGVVTRKTSDDKTNGRFAGGKQEEVARKRPLQIVTAI